MGAGGAHRGSTASANVGFRDVLRIRVFAVLYTAETQSIVGDQLARVALSVLVFVDTDSAPATAATYAATLLPAIFGGVVLSRLGDRYPRLFVMIGCDLLRATCFAVMAIPSVHLGPMIALLVLAVTFGPVFSAAEVSFLSSRLDTDRFRAANALRMTSIQGAQVGGFVLGGVIVALLDPRLALMIDAGTFVLSAALVATADRPNRRPSRPSEISSMSVQAMVGDTSVGGEQAVPFSGIWRDRRLRSLAVMSLLAGFFVVPEGLAVPYGDSVGAATWQVGVLLASGALGGALGATMVIRLLPGRGRTRAAGWMAVACGVPLVLSAIAPRWPVAAVCWFVSGVFAAYIVELTTVIVQAIPDERRSRDVGFLGSLLLATQGFGLVAFGGVAELASPADAVAMAGGLGSLIALALMRGVGEQSTRSQGVQAGVHRA